MQLFLIWKKVPFAIGVPLESLLKCEDSKWRSKAYAFETSFVQQQLFLSYATQND
jgi:hypothetical protein